LGAVGFSFRARKKVSRNVRVTAMNAAGNVPSAFETFASGLKSVPWVAVRVPRPAALDGGVDAGQHRPEALPGGVRVVRLLHGPVRPRRRRLRGGEGEGDSDSRGTVGVAEQRGGGGEGQDGEIRED